MVHRTLEFIEEVSNRTDTAQHSILRTSCFIKWRSLQNLLNRMIIVKNSRY
jgi:hypothetical protein